MNKEELIENQDNSLDIVKKKANKIAKIELSNPDRAFSTWRDLLKNYRIYLDDEQYVQILIYDVLSSICDNHHADSNNPEIIERILPYLAKHSEILELIYCNVGTAIYNNTFYASKCLAGFIVNNHVTTTYTIIKYLSKNKKLMEVKDLYYGRLSPGKFLIRTYEFVNRIIRDNKERPLRFAPANTNRYEVTEDVKEMLYNSLNLFKDPYVRAECAIPIMAMIGYDFKKD